MRKKPKLKYVFIGLGACIAVVFAYIYLGNITLPLYSWKYKHTTQTAYNEASAQLGSPFDFTAANFTDKEPEPECRYAAPPRAFERRLSCSVQAFGERRFNTDADLQEFSDWIKALSSRLEQNEWAATQYDGSWESVPTNAILDLAPDHNEGWLKYRKHIKDNECTLSLETYRRQYDPADPHTLNLSLRMSCSRSMGLP